VESPLGPAAPDPAPEGPAGRFARKLGIMLLVLASFLPYHGCIAQPDDFEPVPLSTSGWEAEDAEAYVPVVRVQWFLRHTVMGERDLQEEDLFLGNSSASDDYGFVIFIALPAWLAAWGLTRRRGSPTRYRTGRVLWCVTLGLPVAVFFCLIDSGMGCPDFPWWLALAVATAAALVVGVRPRGRRGPDDVEATLSTLAILGLGAALCRPLLDYYRWVFEKGHSPYAVAMTFFVNYRPGFWITLVALGLVAAPLYYSEDSLRGLYDRCRPWRSRSSTPTPTSTSTGSTPTGKPSSIAPAPPGSSPS
jgi:hypothetical protein